MSLDPSSLLRQGIDPVAANPGTGLSGSSTPTPTTPRSRSRLANPRGVGFPPGALDWEEYLGALEEINYRGYLTVWPDPNGDPLVQFKAIAGRLATF